ncbi:hypothetical protein CTAYLR_001810 [Chrysophaeum taylorii]|uniref:JmjC domain-containing protein n=1 Tax=Chrysophaeum taylorii TaxID=2483200 RepID=A0AAD7XL22_9STRA|nr:hypothetical protein CTAYLR_001810 [Chrysophaeum taylorii]
MWWCGKAQEEAAPLSADVISDACQQQRAAVSRGVLPERMRGWDGALAKASSRTIMTFFPATRVDQTAFSQQKCHDDHAAIKPSLAFYQWLVSQPRQAWQLRGNLNLGDDELGDALGELSDVLRITSASLWGGIGGSRTPLHADAVHALVLQVAGTKKFFLCSRDEISDAVDAGKLPRAVLDDATTESYCVDGSLASVYGLDAPTPKGPSGHLAVLEAGDCLLLPSGLYHDVECDDDSAALSLTVRFELDEPIGAVDAPCHREENDARRKKGDDLRKLLWRLALKKAAIVQKQRLRDNPPPSDR